MTELEAFKIGLSLGVASQRYGLELEYPTESYFKTICSDNSLKQFLLGLPPINEG